MQCFMCDRSDGKLHIFQDDMKNDTFKRIKFVLPDFAIPESQDPFTICATCVEQVSVFHTIKEASLQNCCRLKQFNAILKGTNNFKYDELSIKINSEEVPTPLNHIEIKVEPNHGDLFLSEDTDPTHVMTEDKEYNFYNQELVIVKSNSNLTSTNSRDKDQTKTQRENQKKRFKCTDCHKEFRTQSLLERHILVHTGEKPYKCATCQQAFTQLSHLNRHKFTHTGEKPHECDVCHKTFIQKSRLIDHKLAHNNVRLYKCSVCSKAFVTSNNLNNHKRIHTGKKPHECHLCQYKCGRASDLRIHIRVHTGNKPYSCKHCKKSFTTTSSLKVHKRRHHSKEGSD